MKLSKLITTVALTGFFAVGAAFAEGDAGTHEESHAADAAATTQATGGHHGGKTHKMAGMHKAKMAKHKGHKGHKGHEGHEQAAPTGDGAHHE